MNQVHALTKKEIDELMRLHLSSVDANVRSRCDMILWSNTGVSHHRSPSSAERGLANKRVSIWIHQGKLHVEHQKTLLAQYVCKMDRKSRTLKSVTKPHLYQTPFASDQLELFELDETQWQKIYHRPPYKHHAKGYPMAEQLPLFG